MGGQTKAVTPPLHQAHPGLQGCARYSNVHATSPALLKPRQGFLRWATSTTCRCIHQDVQPCPDITTSLGPKGSEAPAVAVAGPVARLTKCHMAGLEPPQSMPTPKVGTRPPMMVASDEAWSANISTALGGHSGCLLLGRISGGQGWTACWARRRLLSPLAWRPRLCPSCPSGWDGRDLTCTRRNECASRAWVPGRGGTRYPTATWPDGVDPPQVTSASSLTSPAQPGFRLHAAAAASSTILLWAR